MVVCHHENISPWECVTMTLFYHGDVLPCKWGIIAVCYHVLPSEFVIMEVCNHGNVLPWKPWCITVNYGSESPCVCVTTSVWHIESVCMLQHKYQINVDGTVAAYRLPYLLASDAVVLKQDSPYYEFFYKEVRS